MNEGNINIANQPQIIERILWNFKTSNFTCFEYDEKGNRTTMVIPDDLITISFFEGALHYSVAIKVNDHEIILTPVINVVGTFTIEYFGENDELKYKSMPVKYDTFECNVILDHGIIDTKKLNFEYFPKRKHIFIN